MLKEADQMHKTCCTACNVLVFVWKSKSTGAWTQVALDLHAVLSARALLTSCTQCFAKLVNFSDLGIFAQLCPAHDMLAENMLLKSIMLLLAYNELKNSGWPTQVAMMS